MTKEQDLHDVHEILAGRTDRYTNVIKSSQALVSQIVHRMIAKEWYREDIIQDIYIKVYQNLHHYRGESKLSTWVAKVAYNYCLNELKSKRTKIHDSADVLNYIHDNRADPLQLIAQNDIIDKVNVEIDALPPVYRTIMVLYHQQELSIDEIQNITGIPSGTIKNYLFRARAILADILTSKYIKTELKI